MKILVVDDAADIRDILEFVLQAEGWQVCMADSLAQARQKLQQSIPDIILVDFQLTDGDGISAARNWKAQPDIAQVPVVLYTGNDSHVAAEPALAGVITKDIDPFTLSQRLQEFL